MANKASTKRNNPATVKAGKHPLDEVITSKEVEVVRDCLYALKGIVELAGPNSEEQKITAACVAALVGFIHGKLSDVYCEILNRGAAQ